MADHRFDYPTAAAPTASLTFPRGARVAGDTPSISFVQEISRAKGGAPSVKSYGTARQVLPVTLFFARSSAAGGSHETDLTDMITWLRVTINGAVNSFQWTDDAGTVRTVRCMDNMVSFPFFGHDGQCCTLQLEIEE